MSLVQDNSICPGGIPEINWGRGRITIGQPARFGLVVLFQLDLVPTPSDACKQSRSNDLRHSVRLILLCGRTGCPWQDFRYIYVQLSFLFFAQQHRNFRETFAKVSGDATHIPTSQHSSHTIFESVFFPSHVARLPSTQSADLPAVVAQHQCCLHVVC